MSEVNRQYQAQLIARDWRFESQPTSFYSSLVDEYGYADADAIWLEAGQIYADLHGEQQCSS